MSTPWAFAAEDAGQDAAPALVERVRTRLAAAGPGAPTPAGVAAALRAEGGVVGDSLVLDVLATLRDDAGTGPLEVLVRSPGVSDVLVNGPHDVWVDRGNGLEASAVRFADESAVRQLAQRVAAGAGRRLDDASPFVDVRLPDGSRLHAVLPPVSPGGTCISIRVPSREAFSLDELVAVGSLGTAAADWLRAMVAARLAVLVSGGTGTGKTTLLSTLLGCVDHAERLVLVEDSGELRPDHPHVVRLEARPANIEGAGAVSMRDLVRQALRMRPDRLVVGEVRGGEVVDLLAAMNTGHDGGWGTIHANAAADVPARIEALGVAAGLGQEAVHSQLAAALDAVIHLERRRDGQRRVAEVAMIERGPDGRVRAVAALTALSSRAMVRGPAEPALCRAVGRQP